MPTIRTTDGILFGVSFGGGSFDGASTTIVREIERSQAKLAVLLSIPRCDVCTAFGGHWRPDAEQDPDASTAEQ